MTPTNVFDAHAMIRRLAEQEWPCPGRSLLEIQHFLPCGFCKDTGYVVPFAALRVECPGTGADGVHLKACSKCDLEDCDCCCVTCSGKKECPGWTPEQDVEKACWEGWKALPNRIKQDIADLPFGEKGADSWEEAVLRAAEAWVKEHKA